MNEEYIDNVKHLIEQKDADKVKGLLIDLHPADIAELCNDLNAEEAKFVYRLLDNEIAADVPFSETVRRAKEQGYSEPDPRIDLSGTDVIRKLVILTREAGYRIEQGDVEKHLFVPDEYFQGSVDDFWRNLPKLDADFEQEREQLEREGKRWRFVATMDQGKASVALKAVSKDHPFYSLEGSNNIVLLTTERYKEYPMLIQGYGAGASVTAAGVFANIMSIANI